MHKPLAITLLFLACARAPSAEPPAALQVDERGVTLRADAPQWKYVELTVAANSASLAPLPVPGRVDLDPKRTAAVGVPQKMPPRLELQALQLRMHFVVPCIGRLDSEMDIGFVIILAKWSSHGCCQWLNVCGYTDART